VTQTAVKVFNYTDALTRLVEHAAGTIPEFAHLEPDRMLVACARARIDSSHGVFAKVVPLRFEGGAPTTRRGSRLYQMPSLRFEGREILYLVYFFLPRYQNLPYRRKLVTFFHELYHVSPSFDGDIRRFPGRNFAHGSSRRKYDERMEKFVDAYLCMHGSTELTGFLQPDYAGLRQEYGRLLGRKVPVPRPVLAEGQVGGAGMPKRGQ
jgi:predicted metallopeptidase